jgi:hypothetical protein
MVLTHTDMVLTHLQKMSTAPPPLSRNVSSPGRSDLAEEIREQAGGQV